MERRLLLRGMGRLRGKTEKIAHERSGKTEKEKRLELERVGRLSGREVCSAVSLYLT